MKRTVCILLCAVFALAMPILTSADTRRLFDEADLLSDSQEQTLNETLCRLSDKWGVDLVVAFTNEPTGDDAYPQALTFYRFENFGSDGVIFYFSYYEETYYFLPLGTAEEAFTNAAFDRMEEDCTDALRACDYEEAVRLFASLCDEFLTAQEQEKPYKGDFPMLDYLLIALIVGALVAAIVIFAFLSQLKSVKRQHAARAYLKDGSLDLTHRQDLYLYRTVTRTPRPKSNSGSGGGGGGGRGGRL